jgi:hypothetical protein
VSPQRGAHQGRTEASTGHLELVELTDGLCPRLGVPLPEEGLDELFEQSGLAVGGDAPAA